MRRAALLTRRVRRRAPPSRSRASLEDLRVRDLIIERGLRAAPEVDETMSVKDAIAALVEQRFTSALTRDSHGKIAGILTARDLLQRLHENGCDGLSAPLTAFATPRSKIAWCAPEDALEKTLGMMRALGVRNLPVAFDGEILGMLTAKDIGDYLMELRSSSKNKEAFLNLTEGRAGLPAGSRTVSRERGAQLVVELGGATVEEEDVEVAATRFCLPNPLKLNDGHSARSLSDLNGREPTTDIDLSEDASFVMHSSHATHVGVFDGVGSWRKLGVDPRAYPRSLSKECEQALQDQGSLRPDEVLERAWRRVTDREVPGSSTALLLALRQNSLAYCSLGDCGVVVLRKPDVSGTMTQTGRAQPHNAHRTTTRAPVLVAAQQLRDFNLPYQLGWTNEGGTKPFETPLQANAGTFPVFAGDIIVAATDGLFDNVSLEGVAEVCDSWERERRGSLAEALCVEARKRSLDDDVDSPFALLAKENDVMWGGGMPDDVTVVCLEVAGK